MSPQRRLLKTAEEIRAARIEEAHQRLARPPEEDVRLYLARRLAEANERLDAFRALVATYPQEAFEQSYGAFRAAAQHSIVGYAGRMLVDGYSLHHLLTILEPDGRRSEILANREPGIVEDLAKRCRRSALHQMLLEIRQIMQQHADAVSLLYELHDPP